VEDLFVITQYVFVRSTYSLYISHHSGKQNTNCDVIAAG
jgi:hypothetical protein